MRQTPEQNFHSANFIVVTICFSLNLGNSAVLTTGIAFGTITARTVWSFKNTAAQNLWFPSSMLKS